jgi:phage FluMu protein Com
MESRIQPASSLSCDAEDYRCLCGSLMAKITPLGVEIKCRKCKRIQVIPNSQVTLEAESSSAKAAAGMV